MTDRADQSVTISHIDPLNPRAISTRNHGQNRNEPTYFRHQTPRPRFSAQPASRVGSIAPDCVAIEGPPDAADALPLLAHRQMKPPVALLIYPPDQPQRAVFTLSPSSLPNGRR